MKKKYMAWLFILMAVFTSINSYAAFRIPHADLTGYHGGGHHSGGHHSHGGHYHHSYHSSGFSHHYSEHYHHYHNHYHVWHEGVWGMDFAGASIFFDVLGLIPIAVFSILGIAFGAAGIRSGRRRALATAGVIIGVAELLILAAVVIILLAP